MDRLFSLDRRLLACASLVRENARLADIGTDHAYLPIWLLKQNKISYAVACDINPLPLEAGRANRDRYGVKNIDFRLGCGLEPLAPEDNITDIVIAGMGGELIEKILGGSSLVRNKEFNIVLQPMTRSCELIAFLYREGFEITAQKAMVSRGKCYTAMALRYTGVSAAAEEVFCCTGKLDLAQPDSVRFIQQQIKHNENKAKGEPGYKELAQKLREIIKL